MSPRTPERLWCDEQGITVDQARRLGGYLHLIELKQDHPEIFALMIADAKRKRGIAA